MIIIQIFTQAKSEDHYWDKGKLVALKTTNSLCFLNIF